VRARGTGQNDAIAAERPVGPGKPTLTLRAESIACADPGVIPVDSIHAYNDGVLACDGAFGSSTQRGKGRRLEGRPSCWMAEIQEARCDRFRWSVSNGAEPETAERHMACRACGV
jgi:hypothetical protein